MLLVATFLDKSSISGVGVFTTEPISPRTLVWRFLPAFDLEIEMETFATYPLVTQQYVLHYGNLTAPSGGSKSKGIYLLCGDNARFMNHSTTPNLLADSDDNFALRHIPAGEELTCDYREFDLAFKAFA